MIARGVRDMIALPISNMIYMQLGFAISRTLSSATKAIINKEDENVSDVFNEGLKDYYDTYLDPNKILLTSLSSLTSLATGKYGYATNAIGSFLLGATQKNKDLDKDTKEQLESFGKGMYIRPLKIKGGRPYELFGLHPASKELYALSELVQETIASAPNFIEDLENGDKDAIELVYLLNNVARYMYVNPVSNILNNELNKVMHTNKKDKSDTGIQRGEIERGNIERGDIERGKIER
jgi:hypothetical protein